MSISFVNINFRFVEQNTDDILNNPDKMDKSKHTSQEDIEETVSTCKYITVK